MKTIKLPFPIGSIVKINTAPTDAYFGWHGRVIGYEILVYDITKHVLDQKSPITQEFNVFIILLTGEKLYRKAEFLTALQPIDLD